MSGMAFICIIMLLGIGGAVLIALLSAEAGENEQDPGAFAVLPVPEDSPAARAMLEHYASQILWMDAKILRCVILVCQPRTQAMCEELARDYPCYTVMSADALQDFLRERLESSGKS